MQAPTEQWLFRWRGTVEPALAANMEKEIQLFLQELGLRERLRVERA